MDNNSSATTLSDRELLAATVRAATTERHTTALLIALLTEVDGRRLYLGEGYPSLFRYCTDALHLSEHATYERITAARVAKRLPSVLARLMDGSVTLTAVGLLAAHLDDDNCEGLLQAARHKSKREVEHLVASIDPKPDLPTSIRRVPNLKGADGAPLVPPAVLPALGPLPAGIALAATPQTFVKSSAATPRTLVTPVATERYAIKVTVSAETHANLCRAQALLRHTIPNGDPAAVLDRALTLLVEHLEKTRFAATKSAGPKRAKGRASRPPSTGGGKTRHIAADVRRTVWVRDGGRCAFVGNQGRCPETAFLEFHHGVPYADGGASTVDNISLRCRAHNAHEAVRWFGEELRT